MSLELAVAEFNQLVDRAIREEWDKRALNPTDSRHQHYSVRVQKVKELSRVFSGAVRADDEALALFKLEEYLSFDTDAQKKVLNFLGRIPLACSFNQVKTLSQLYPNYFSQRSRVSLYPKDCSKGSIWVNSFFGKIRSLKRESFELSLMKMAEELHKVLFPSGSNVSKVF